DRVVDPGCPERQRDTEAAEGTDRGHDPDHRGGVLGGLTHRGLTLGRPGGGLPLGLGPPDRGDHLERRAVADARGGEDEQEGDTYYRVERRYGSFFRKIPLPQEVDEDRIEAKYSDGVLEVVVPGVTTGSSEKKKIPVQQVTGKLKKALGSGRKR
ncbi:MAG: Hsp20/alpha crystallin family protein, partial [Actinobacteria bacterium]|nr:Hsp20/alpha crystallin family protein [Actinomycetota bacterium]